MYQPDRPIGFCKNIINELTPFLSISDTIFLNFFIALTDKRKSTLI